MPRKLKTWSKTVIIDVTNHSSQSLSSLDKFVVNELKVSGRGNRVKVDEIGALILALQAARQNTKRSKAINLNISDLQNPLVISALDDLGVLARVLTNRQRNALLNGKITIELREDINRAAYHYMKQARKYL